MQKQKEDLQKTLADKTRALTHLRLLCSGGATVLQGCFDSQQARGTLALLNSILPPVIEEASLAEQTYLEVEAEFYSARQKHTKAAA